MYVMALRRLLEMYPAGASSEQILYHLRTSGTRATAADILQSLNMLSGSGEATVVANGRWKLAKFLSVGSSPVGNLGRPDPGAPTDTLGALLAVAGHILPKPPFESDFADPTAL